MNKIAIIAGGGNLPVLLAKELVTQYYIIAIKDSFDSVDITPDIYAEIGSVGSILQILQKEDIKEVIFAGNINRPNFSNLKLDSEGIRLMALITKNKILGDNNVLSTIIKFLQKRAYKVIGADEILNKNITERKVIGNVNPTNDGLRDINIAKDLLNTISRFDIGQAVMIENGLILGIEAAEGTDGLIKRCVDLRKNNIRSGILVKLKKVCQERKIDLPTIGIETVKNIISAGFAGIALEAGSSFILDKEEVIKLADENNIFIIGV